MNITKDHVLLYLLDQIHNPQQREEIEQARKTDSQVASWFALLEEDVADEDAEDVLDSEDEFDWTPSAEAKEAFRSLFGEFTQPQQPVEAAHEPPAEQALLSHVADMIRVFEQGSDEIPASALTALAEFPWGRYDGLTHTYAGGSLFVEAHTNDEQASWPEMMENNSLTLGEDGVVSVMYDADKAPFGVVRLFAFEKDSRRLLGTCVLALPQFGEESQPYRLAEIPLSDITGPLPDPQPAIDLYAAPAREDSLPWFSVEAVKALLEQPYIAAYQELAERVKELLDRLQQGEKTHGDN